MLLQDFQARLVSQPTEWEKIFANDMTNKFNIQNISTGHPTQYKKKI